MENCQPQGKRCCKDAIHSKVAAGMNESKCSKKQQQQEMTCVVDNKISKCPGALAAGVDELRKKHQLDECDDKKSLEYRCPGTMDILSGRMVPCSAAPTLREIALGRRMRRTVVDYPECEPAKEMTISRRSKTHRVEKIDERNGQCSCTGNRNNSDYQAECGSESKIKIDYPKPEQCCGRKRKVVNQGRCVTFDR